MWKDQADAFRRRFRPTPLRARRFIRPGLTVDEFLGALTRQGAHYAVLRWFETLPSVDPGEDIDLLIADDDLAIVEPLLRPRRQGPAAQKVDLYTVSGLRGTSYRGVPYFPKKLALRILDRAVLLDGKYKVPCPADHLDSLAFHAVYHKGTASGLPARDSEAPAMVNADHDYGATLQRLSAGVGERAELTLQGLDRYLAERGLRPATDLLERYQTRNDWLRHHLAGERHDIGTNAGIITFVVRDRAVPYIAEIECIIEKHGFELLETVALAEIERDRVRECVRGGNWACGPFPQSGGDPACVIVAYDFNYRTEPGADGQLINRNGAAAKQAVRELIDSRVAANERFNPMHSTDNGWQSLECLSALGREGLMVRAERQIAAMEREVAPPWSVIRPLSVSGRRARVLVVDHPEHGTVVAKMFRPGADRFFQRELLARQLLDGVPGVPALIEHGRNWFLMPLYSDIKVHVVRRLPGSRQVQLTHEAMLALGALVRALRANNMFLLDLASHNLISDPHAGLLVLDFEFLQKYPGELPPLDRDATVVGVSPDVGFDSPIYEHAGRWALGARRTVFHPVSCGLAPGEFVAPGPGAFLRARKMAALQAFWWTALLVRRRWRLLSRRRSVVAARRLVAAVARR